MGKGGECSMLLGSCTESQRFDLASTDGYALFRCRYFRREYRASVSDGKGSMSDSAV